jgi:hypothetical protein
MLITTIVVDCIRADVKSMMCVFWRQFVIFHYLVLAEVEKEPRGSTICIVRKE